MLDYTKTELHFKPLNYIGAEGKNSTVYTAHDHQLDATIVVKQISKDEFSDPDEYFNEAKQLYLSSHPNIVPVQYACSDDDNIYITMPFFKKGSVSSLMSKRYLRPKEIIKFGIDFLSALHHIHTKGLVHCDVKPNNILISDSGDAVLTDFGLGRFLNPSGTATLDYLYYTHQPPEIAIGNNEINHQCDIYQAGLTLYRMCNGDEFFEAQLEQFVKAGVFDEDKFRDYVVKGKFPDRSKYLEHIPQKLRNAIRKAMNPNPADRYKSVLDFMNDLANIDVPRDWQKTKEVAGTIYDCLVDERQYKLYVKEIAAGKFSVQTSKKVGAGKETRITAHCKEDVAEGDVSSIIKDILTNLSV